MKRTTGDTVYWTAPGGIHFLHVGASVTPVGGYFTTVGAYLTRVGAYFTVVGAYLTPVGKHQTVRDVKKDWFTVSNWMSTPMQGVNIIKLFHANQSFIPAEWWKNHLVQADDFTSYPLATGPPIRPVRLGCAVWCAHCPMAGIRPLDLNHQ